MAILFGTLVNQICPPRKLINSQKIESLGWSPSISLADGLQDTYQAFLDMELNNRLLND